jgi:hypothetical protein
MYELREKLETDCQRFFIAEDAYNEHIYEEIPETRQQRLRPLPPIPEGTSLRQGCSTGAQTTTIT